MKILFFLLFLSQFFFISQEVILDKFFEQILIFIYVIQN